MDAVKLIPRALDEAAAFFGFGDFVGGAAGDAGFAGDEGKEGGEDREEDGAEMHFVAEKGSVGGGIRRSGQLMVSVGLKNKIVLTKRIF